MKKKSKMPETIMVDDVLSILAMAGEENSRQWSAAMSKIKRRGPRMPPTPAMTFEDRELIKCEGAADMLNILITLIGLKHG